MEILILLLLTLINGLFSMSEIALISSRKFKLEQAVRRGSSGAQKALDLSNHPNHFLSTVQIGITLIGILLGIYSGEKLTAPLQQWIANLPALAPYAGTIATVTVLICTTFLAIILGELFPKRLGMSFPEQIAAVIALPMYWLSRLTAPFVWLLTKANDLLLWVFGINASTDAIVTEEEIRSMLSAGAESGQIEEIEQDIVERVFALGDRKVSALMTHRSDIIWLDISDTPETIRAKVGEEIHGAYPVCDGDLDHLLGLVRIRDLFLNINKTGFKLEEHLVQPVFAPPGSSAYKLLENFRKSQFHYAVIVDEFGAFLGMITMDDILDALVGDVSSQDEEPYRMVANGDQGWIADGQYPFFEFLHQMEIDDEAFTNVGFTTLAGFMIDRLQQIPLPGAKIEWEGFQFEVLEMDARRISRIGIRKL